MTADRSLRLSERYARVWDLLGAIAASDCGCDAQHTCPSCAAQHAMGELAAAVLEKPECSWRELFTAVAALESKGL